MTTPPPMASPPSPGKHYVGGETITAEGKLERITQTPAKDSDLQAIVLTIAPDGTTGKRLHCKLTLGASAPNLPPGSSIAISGKVDETDPDSLEDCAMLAK